jgi:TRAP-type C4-dicarboxylate transport system permease small subunit
MIRGSTISLTGSVISRATGLVYIIAEVVMVSMMLLVAAEVFLRYFFNSPILGTTEIIEFMMVVLVFFGLAYTQTRKGHIGVDVVIIIEITVASWTKS